MSVPRLVAIDDNRQALSLISAALEREGVEITCCNDPAEGLQAVLRLRPAVVLLDLMMPGRNGLEVLDDIVRFDPAIDVILVTAHYSTESAVSAIQKGAADYLEKPLDIDKLRARVRAALRTRERGEDTAPFHGIIGAGPAMRELFARIRRVGPHFRTVLVTGPTGSGKELVARALHETSPAREGPFVVCNCAAIAETLIESELFGYVRGAFTGAAQDRAGLFEFAHNGTLLLDEIGEMPLAAQAKLLRAVQQQEVQRVGSPAVKKVNVRVIASTHRNPRAMAKAGTFREDLYFRLGIVEVRLPALNERREDIPALTAHFVRHYAELYGRPVTGVTRRAGTFLAGRDWKGNVRELEGFIAHGAMMADPPLIDVRDFPLEDPAAPEEDLALSIDDVQALHARRVVDSLGGDKAEAAKVLGVSRATLYRLLGRAKEA